MMEILLEHGANLEEHGSDLCKPLHNGTMLGNSEAAKVLLEAGAKLEACDYPSQTPLHLVARFN